MKITDKNDSSIHLIRVNQLHKLSDGKWNDKWVYDLHKNEFGKVENGKFIKCSTINIHGLGDCYHFNCKGEVQLFKVKWFLDELRDAAVEYIDKVLTAGKPSVDEKLINL